jgi:hypothetical protein
LLKIFELYKWRGKMRKNYKEKVRYQYKACGLNIYSEMCLPQLMKSDFNNSNSIDVTISYGSTPKELIQPIIIQGEDYKLSQNEYLFHIDGIASYYVAGGNKIIIEPELNSNEEDIKIYLLGTALGTLLLQRGALPLHGGSVVVEEKGIIILGSVGAGKSTLTSAFRLNGFPLLSDDISVVSKNKDESFIVHPGYAEQKLCKDVMELLRFDTSKYSKVFYNNNKYTVPVNDNFFEEAVPIIAIYELVIGEGHSTEIEEVRGLEKIGVLLRNIYRINVLRNIGCEAEYLKTCVDIVKSTPFFRISRPQNIFSVEEQMNLITNSIKYIDKKVV